MDHLLLHTLEDTPKVLLHTLQGELQHLTDPRDHLEAREVAVVRVGASSPAPGRP